MAWLIPLSALAKKRGGDDPRHVGGKASRLVWLHKNELAVPDAWVLPNRAFLESLRKLPASCEPKSLLRGTSARGFSLRVAEARQELLSAPLPDGLEVELGELWASVESSSPWGLAIRSSATCEDGTVASMAGLAETRLAVFGPEAMATAIREVWASLASGRALSYLASHGIRDVGMAVVLQRMVRARAAGVMFTRASFAEGSRVVNASFGLGAPVVDGVSTPDMLRLDDKGRALESVVAHKRSALVVRDRALALEPVSTPDAPALDSAVCEELAEIATRLEKIDPAAWDVEFAHDGERAWIVQARPVTGQGFPEGGDALTVWSNANVGEALPGVATPLTWSVAGAFSEDGFRRAFAALGCTVPKNAKLVGDVYGRFYLNLSQFMRVAAQVPWLDPKTLVELGGGSGGEELARDVADVSHTRFFARLPLTATRLAKEQLRLDADVARYERDAESARRFYAALDLAILPDESLARTIRDLQALLARTGTVMLTCASSALGSHLALSGVLSRLAPARGDRLAQSLTAGIRDLESARPAMGILRVASLARSDAPALRALQEDGVASIDAIPDGPTRRALVSFLDLYGDRAVREAELATPRWREDPRPVLSMLKVALRGEARDVESQLARARANVEADTVRLLPKLALPVETAVRHLVARTQKSARLRERMRAWVTRVLGMMRVAFLDADRRIRRLAPELTREGEGAIPAVFFLTVDEVVHALQQARTDLAPLVRARRAEYARNVARPDPPPTFVGAPPPVLLPPSGGDVLRGIAAGSGVVEGKARVILSADRLGDLEPGEVLVVRSTDVGWTPLFPLAAGVVTELGGPLSHAAVVARELGVPTVVNVAGATRVFRTGDRLRIDGARGTVERLRG